MARIIKTLVAKMDKEGARGYAHRDHRSKKNRKFVPQKAKVMAFKRKKEALKHRD